MQNVLLRSGARAYTVSDDASADQRYGVEIWGTNTTIKKEKWSEVTEIKMLRQMCGVTRKDKIKNEYSWVDECINQSDNKTIPVNDYVLDVVTTVFWINWILRA